MKKETLIALVKAKLVELRAQGVERYDLYTFCVEVIPESERQSKHVDILEMLLDWGFELNFKGLKFQPVCGDERTKKLDRLNTNPTGIYNED